MSDSNANGPAYHVQATARIDPPCVDQPAVFWPSRLLEQAPVPAAVGPSAVNVNVAPLAFHSPAPPAIADPAPARPDGSPVAL